MKKKGFRRSILAVAGVLVLIIGLFAGAGTKQTRPLTVLADYSDVYLQISSFITTGTQEEMIQVDVCTRKGYVDPPMMGHMYMLMWDNNVVSHVTTSSNCGSVTLDVSPEYGYLFCQVYNDIEPWKTVGPNSVLESHIFRVVHYPIKCTDEFVFSINGEYGYDNYQRELTEWDPGLLLEIRHKFDGHHNWTWDTSVSPSTTYVGFTWKGSDAAGYTAATANYVCGWCGKKTTYDPTPVTYKVITPPQIGVAGLGQYDTWIGPNETLDHAKDGHTGYRQVAIPPLEATRVPVTKVWNDGDNQDGIRPGSVTVHLIADGADTGKTAQLTAAGGWAYTFTDIRKTADDGHEINYTVTEEAVPGYSGSVSGTTITNTHAPETTQVTVTKTWDDQSNTDGVRPGSVTVHLLADGAEVQAGQITEASGWAITFSGLPKNKNGKAIGYSVTEDPVPGYTTEISGFNIVNRHAPEKTTVTVTKTWDDAGNQDGKRPESVTVHLLADGAEVQSGQITEASGWAIAFPNLPKFAGGKEIGYTVTEDPVPGYTTEIKGLEIVNAHTPETTEFTVTKVWEDEDDADGLRPPSVTVHLLADGAETDMVDLDEAGSWTHTFTDLPKYKDGKEIVYTVTEDAVTGYDTEIKDGTVTNRHTVETETETESESETESETETKKETEKETEESSESETETPGVPGKNGGSGKNGGPFGKGGAWALLNLLAMIATAVTAVGMAATVFTGRSDRVKRAAEETDESYKARKEEAKRDSPAVGLKFLGLIPAVLSVVVFLLTEDLSKPMVLYDIWTVVMVLLLIVALVLAFVTRRRKKKGGKPELEEIEAEPETEEAGGRPQA